MVLLKARLQALENLDGLLNSRFNHFHFLEATRQRGVLFEDAAELGEGCSADALQLAGTQGRLEQIARVQRAPRSRSSADQGVDFVNEQHGTGLLLELLDHSLEPLFEITAVLGTCQQGPHVERINLGIGQHIGHILLGDAPGQSFSDGGLANTSFTHQQWIVLATTAQHLNDTLDLGVATDQRINLAIASHLVQILRVLLQWRGLAFCLFLLGLSTAGGLRRRLRRFGRICLANAVGNEIDHIQTSHPLLVQVVNRMRILFAKDGHQYIRPGDLFLATARALHVHDRALNDTLEPQGGLGIDLIGATHSRRVVSDELIQVLAQLIQVSGAGLQHLGSRGVVDQGQQQVFDGDELVTLLSGLDEGHVQTHFQLLRNHAVSRMHCRGCPARRAAARTSSTLVAATSLVKTPHTPRPSWWIFSMICVAVSIS